MTFTASELFSRLAELDSDQNSSFTLAWSDNLSVADVIRSRNDDPSNFDAAYIIRSDRTFVQYHKPGVGGKEPIPSADVQTWLDQNVSDMVSQVVNKTLLTDAKTNFGQ